ncbi:MAG TPA: DUF1501 domain-containing protein [Gemmata sp.]|nr:DUF1501 domain-containing protein [Gemmata sp.]
MLRVTGEGGSDCSGLTRRSFIQAGVLGGAIGLGDLFRARAIAESKPPVSDPCVILFWMSGGPGHMETWDPKPNAVSEFRGPFGATQTSIPGIQFGELLPEHAKIADKLAILRGVCHGTGDHTKANHWMLTGFEGPAFNAPDFMTQRRPSMGSAVAKLHGANRPGLPPYAAVPHLRGGTDNFFHYAAYLGRGANPFITESDPNTPEFRVRNLALPKEVPIGRLEDRRSLLESLDAHRREADRSAADLDPHMQRAFSLLTGKQAVAAFDIAAEPDKLRDRYGRHTFGQSALLARRLIEAGVTFVTVNCVPWDHHGTAGRHRTDVGGKLLIPPFDQALAALVRDLIDRGLYERTLIVAMGEFGRTPRMNPEGGRDHWGNVFSVLMGCGSMKMGQTIGRSNTRGEYPTDRPTSPEDVTATVFHHLGIDARSVRFTDDLMRPTALVETGQPIRELVR